MNLHHGNDYSCRARRFVAGTLVDFERSNAFSVVEAGTHVREWSFPAAAEALGVHPNEELLSAFLDELKGRRKVDVEEPISDEALYDAARTSAAELAKLLTARAWGPTELNVALRFAAKWSHPEGVVTLLAHGARDDENHALSEAVCAGSVEALDALMAAKSEPIDASAFLHKAISFRSKDVLRWLLHHGADVDRHDDLGVAPLHVCAFHGRPDEARMLLEAGAQVDAKTTAESFMASAGETALEIAERMAKQNGGRVWSKVAGMLGKPAKSKRKK